MVIVETSDGFTYEIPEILPKAPIIAQAVVDGNTHLNLNDGDQKHLVLTADLTNLESYIECLDTNGNTKAEIDATGTVIANDFSTELISSYNTKFNDHDTALANYAATATQNHNTQQDEHECFGCGFKNTH